LSAVEAIEIGCIAIAALGMAAKRAVEQLPIALEERQRIAERIPRFFKSGNWAYAPVILICVAALLWISQNISWPLSPSPTINVQAPASTTLSGATGEFVEEQRVERRIPSNVDGTQSVIVYHARYLVTGKHLRAILEYEGIDYIPAISNLMQRVMLGDFHDFLKNGDLEIPVISRDGHAFWWGNEGKDHGVLFFGNLQVRIRLIDDDGREQHYYFMVTGGSIPNTVGGGIIPLPYPDIVMSDNLGFPAQWEAYDAKH
jgi:hypothetical protein